MIEGMRSLGRLGRIVVAVGVSVLTVSYGRALNPDRALTQYAMDIFHSAEGLPQSSVYAIAQTEEGYLWLGTQRGLARFDGVRFEAFGRREPGLRHDWSQALLADAGALWVGTVGGGASRLRGRRFEPLGEGEAAELRVRAIARDGAGTVWIGSDTGLYSVTRGELVPWTGFGGKGLGRVNALAAGARGSLWVGTEVGLLRIDGADLAVQTWGVSEGLPHERVVSLLSIGPGEVWVGTERGLVHLRGDEMTVFDADDGLGSDFVTALWPDRAGSLWVGTYGGGLSRITDASVETMTVDDGLPSGLVISLFEDFEGSLWIGTDGGGLARLRDTPLYSFGTREGLSSDLALAISQDPDGTIWLGTAGGGLNRVRDGVIDVFTSAEGLSSDLVFSVIRDDRGQLWVGTDAGLDILRGGGFEPWVGRGGEPWRVRVLHEGVDGSLWVGTDGQGVFQIRDGAILSHYHRGAGLSSDVITCIFSEAEGAVWVGTHGGLDVIRAGSVDTIGGLPSDFILTIFEDQDGDIWVGTFQGVAHWSGGRLTSLTADHGMTEGAVGGILADDRGSLWMSTNTGVFEVPRRALQKASRGGASVVPRWYGRADGMRSLECNGGYQPAAWRMEGGDLWFPTVKGAVIIEPGATTSNPRPPAVVLEEAWVDQLELPLDGPPPVIDPDAHKVEFRFTAPSLLIPERVRFKYQLEGFDADWVEAAGSRTAQYTNLPARDYTFRVIASNDSGVWNRTGAAFSFRQRAHYWETAWFWALCLAGAVALAVKSHRVRVRHLQDRERQLSALVEEKTHHLSIAVDELSIRNDQLRRLNEEKNEFLGIATHDLKNPLNVIRGYAELLLDEPDVDPSEREAVIGKILLASERMIDLIRDLLDVNAIERGELVWRPVPCEAAALASQVVTMLRQSAAGKGQTLEFEAPADPAVAFADPRLTTQILENLVSNAVKYSPHDRTIRVRVSRHEEVIRFEVHDQGPGLSEEDLGRLFGKFTRLTPRPTGDEHSTGLGLSIVKRMVEAMNGRVWCESRLGEGASFFVELPSFTGPQPPIQSSARA